MARVPASEKCNSKKENRTRHAVIHVQAAAYLSRSLDQAVARAPPLSCPLPVSRVIPLGPGASGNGLRPSFVLGVGGRAGGLTSCGRRHGFRDGRVEATPLGLCCRPTGCEAGSSGFGFFAGARRRTAFGPSALRTRERITNTATPGGARALSASRDGTLKRSRVGGKRTRRPVAGETRRNGDRHVWRVHRFRARPKRRTPLLPH